MPTLAEALRDLKYQKDRKIDGLACFHWMSGNEIQRPDRSFLPIWIGNIP